MAAYRCSVYSYFSYRNYFVNKKPGAFAQKTQCKREGSGAEQKSVVLLGALMFIGGFVLAGLDYRFKWLVLPKVCDLLVDALR